MKVGMLAGMVLLALVMALLASVLGQWISVQRAMWAEEDTPVVGEEIAATEGWVVVRSGETEGWAHWYVDEATGVVIADEFYLEVQG